MEMNKIKGEDRLNEIQSQPLRSKRVCKKGYKFCNKLQCDVRLFLGDMFGMRYYILISETSSFNQIKKLQKFNNLKETIQIKNLKKRFGSNVAVDDLTLNFY